MGNGYSTWYRESAGILATPSRVLERVRRELSGAGSSTSPTNTSLHVSRLVLLATIILLLTFSAVFRLTDAGGIRAFWLEIGLSLCATMILTASYGLPIVRRNLSLFIRLFSYLTAAFFILLAAANGFDSDYAVGLLFIVPGLGAGYGLATHARRSLAVFFGITFTGASVGCLLTAGPIASSIVFMASLLCLSCVTLIGAAGWLDARKRYLASEQRYRAVVEQASDGIFMLDADTLDILDANPAFCSMLGIGRWQIPDMEIGDILERVDGNRFSPDSLLEGRSHRVECILRRVDGTTLFGELHVDRIRHSDADVLSIVVHDITSRKQYEERLLRAKESAEEIARFKSTLLANMSHEIRTPLSSILGWASILGKEVPVRQRELVELIETSGKRLHSTLDSVLELAHLQANAKQLCPSRFDVNGAVRQAVGVVQSEADLKGLSLVTQTSETPAWVEADPACLRRVLRHVLDNAVKFTEEGAVTVSVDRDGTDVMLTVEDTGIGISREFMPSMFDEFTQESAGLSREHEGSGLGLTVVRRLTDLIGGRIDITSERGVGTRFTLYLPEMR